MIFSKEAVSSNGQGQHYLSGFLIVMLVSVCIAVGCNQESSKKSFDEFGSSGGLSLEKPGNWQVRFDDRTETIMVTSERGILSKDSVRIVIQPFTTSAIEAPLTEHLGAAINIMGIRHNLNSVRVVQESTLLNVEDYEIGTATIILAPANGTSEDSNENQVGTQEANAFQKVDLVVIRCADNFAIAYVYQGKSEQLNAEAEEIVNSIELTCLTEP